MITNTGKELIARFLGAKAASWAGAVEFGVGTTAATVNDTSLEFPFVRVPVDFLDYNPSTYEVTVRAMLPSNTEGEFHEVGIFSNEDYPEGEAGHQLLLDFSSADTTYVTTNASVSSANARVGGTAFQLAAPAAGTATLRAFTPGLALNQYSGNDTVNLAYSLSSGTPGLTIRFETTQLDYFEYTFNPSAGYNIETWARSLFTQTGTPSWSDISSIWIEVAGESDLTLDGLMIEDTINIEGYGMVARTIISPPLTKSVNREVEFTYKLNLGF